jgi:hypothetical protein
VARGFTVEPPDDELLEPTAGREVAAGVCTPVFAEPAMSFIARADQTMSSKPTLPPARYMRASV